MTFAGDPYRTLGIAPGASVNEIKAAYRRMAKRYHPDAAGERALPRFLAIQAAYEQLVDANGELRRRSTPGGPGGNPARPASGRPSQPWRADPSRAQASRDAWRERRAGGPAGGGATTGTSSSSASGGGAHGPPASGTGPSSGDGQEASSGSGSSSSSGPEAAGTGRRASDGRGEHVHWRHRRRATPGSTTYDEAADAPLDPSWDGGTWSGTSSGTYWTINPREYADPRKHGPEYQRRARRGFRGGDGDLGSAGDEPWPPPSDGEPWAWRTADAGRPDDAAGRPGDAAGRPDDAAGRPDDAAGAAAASGPDGGAWAPGPDDGAWTSGPRDDLWAPGPEAAATPSTATPSAGPARARLWALMPGRLLEQASGDDIGRRIAVAAVAALPVPLGMGIVLAEIAGCTAGVACPPMVPLLALVAWPVAVIVLAAIPAAAALGAFAAGVAGLAVLLTAALVAAVNGDLASALGASVGTVGVIVYCFALVMGGIRLFERPEAPRRGP